MGDHPKMLYAMVRDRDFTEATDDQLAAVICGTWAAEVHLAARDERSRRVISPGVPEDKENAK